jgi:hypothetical protein
MHLANDWSFEVNNHFNERPNPEERRPERHLRQFCRRNQTKLSIF